MNAACQAQCTHRDLLWRLRFLGAGLVLTGMTIGTSRAQIPVEKCLKIFDKNVYDTESVLTARYSFRSLKNFLRDSKAETIEQLKQEADRASVDYEPFSADYERTRSSRDYRTWKSDFLQTSEDTFINSEFFKSHSKKVSQSLAHVAEVCLDALKDHPGLHLVMKPDRSKTTLHFSMFYIPSGDEECQLKDDVQFLPQSARTAIGVQTLEHLKRGARVTRAGTNFSIPWDRTKAYTITVNATQPPQPPWATLDADPELPKVELTTQPLAEAVSLGDNFRICPTGKSYCLGTLKQPDNASTFRVLASGTPQADTDKVSLGFAFALQPRNQPVLVQYKQLIHIRGVSGDPYWHIESGKIIGGNINGHEQDATWQFILQNVGDSVGQVRYGDAMRILDGTGTKGLGIKGEDLVAVPAVDAISFRIER